MSQSSIIAAALIVAFLVFITVRGELPAYLAVFTGKDASQVSIGSTGGTGGGTVISPGGGGNNGLGGGIPGGSASGGLCQGNDVIIGGVCTNPNSNGGVA